MTVRSQLISDDVQQMFLDWGQTASLIEVSSTYDAVSGRVVESEFAKEITVVVHPDRPLKRPETTGLTATVSQSFLIRETDASVLESLVSCRVRLKETVYAIRSASQSHLNGVIRLDCVSDRIPAH